jgi:NHS family xanthosine MFS transporter
MIMTNGFGAFFGGIASGYVVDLFTINGTRDWHSIWLFFAGYALVLGIIFPFVFRYKHERKVIKVSNAEAASDGATFRP